MIKNNNKIKDEKLIPTGSKINPIVYGMNIANPKVGMIPKDSRQLPTTSQSSVIPNYELTERNNSQYLKDMLGSKNRNTSPAGNGANDQQGYDSPYSTQIESLLGQIMNRTPFSYNMNADPLYNQYKDQYTKQGNLAMRDTMGNASGMTGGYGSTYGEIAGSQTYDSYLGQLNDKVPELQSQAYDKYLNELVNSRNDLSTLQGLDQTSYNQYRDNVGDTQLDRSYNYGVSQDALAQKNYEGEFAYNQSQDALGQKNWQTEFNYGKTQDTLGQKNWQTEFDYGKTQDEIDQDNYLNEFAYGKTQDAQNQSNWNTQFNYNKSQDSQSNAKSAEQFAYQKQQDALDRQAATNDYAAEQLKTKSETQVKASTAKIETYSKNVDKMFSATISDGFEGTKSKYSSKDIWNYIDGSDLTDDEAMVIVNGNYELRKYVEGLQQNQQNQRTHSTGGRNF